MPTVKYLPLSVGVSLFKMPMLHIFTMISSRYLSAATYHGFFFKVKNASHFMSCNALEPGHFQNCVILRTPNVAALSYTWYTHWHRVLTKPKNLSVLSTDFHNNVPSPRITYSAQYLCYKALCYKASNILCNIIFFVKNFVVCFQAKPVLQEKLLNCLLRLQGCSLHIR